jgi:hypothetical protein
MVIVVVMVVVMVVVALFKPLPPGEKVHPISFKDEP